MSIKLAFESLNPDLDRNDFIDFYQALHPQEENPHTKDELYQQAKTLANNRFLERVISISKSLFKSKPVIKEHEELKQQWKVMKQSQLEKSRVRQVKQTTFKKFIPFF